MAPAAHTLEHLLATFMRNGEYADSVVYVGPMGCRTGFYILLRDKVAYATAIEFVKAALVFAKPTLTVWRQSFLPIRQALYAISRAINGGMAVGLPTEKRKRAALIPSL